jgi:protein-disulfide isomerase
VEEEEWGTDAFVACFDGGGATERMDALASLAASLDVQSVPTSFLNGERIVGLLEYAELQGMVKDAMKR